MQDLLPNQAYHVAAKSRYSITLAQDQEVWLLLLEQTLEASDEFTFIHFLIAHFGNREREGKILAYHPRVSWRFLSSSKGEASAPHPSNVSDEYKQEQLQSSSQRRLLPTPTNAFCGHGLNARRANPRDPTISAPPPPSSNQAVSSMSRRERHKCCSKSVCKCMEMDNTSVILSYQTPSDHILFNDRGEVTAQCLRRSNIGRREGTPLVTLTSAMPPPTSKV